MFSGQWEKDTNMEGGGYQVGSVQGGRDHLGFRSSLLSTQFPEPGLHE